MKLIILIFILAFNAIPVLAQDALNKDARYIDNLKYVLSQAKEDTNKVNLYSELSGAYRYSYPDTTLFYAFPGLELARKLKFKKGEIVLMTWIAEAFAVKGSYPKAMEIKLRALEKAENLNDSLLISECHNYLGAFQMRIGDYQKALFYYNKTRANKVYFRNFKKYIVCQTGICMYHLHNPDSAYYYIRQAYDLDVKDKIHWTVPYFWMAIIEEKKGNYANALNFYRTGNQVARNGALDILIGYKGMAFAFNKMGRKDSATFYAKMVVEEGIKRSSFTPVIEASNLLTDLYKSRQAFDSAFKYQQIMLAIKDSLFSQDKVNLIQNILFKEQRRQQQEEQERKLAQQQYETKIKLYSLMAGLTVISLIAFILYRNNQNKQKAYALLQQQKGETEQQKAKAEQTLEELKATQAELIEQEKVALENKLQVELLKKEQELAVYQSRAVELEMQALRAQMNPHFIFNCLNSINRFMLKNESEQASDYLTKFSKLIRLILLNSQSQTVLLENELEALELYLAMEMLRFEDQFDYQIKYDPELEIEDLEVPPLIIQPYVENAIWHGLMHKEGKGNISIYLQRRAQTLICSIEDDGVGRKRAAELNSKSATKKKSLGMQITSHRLQLLKELFGKQPTVTVEDLVDASGEACGTRVVIEIPV